jgi:hypothetical protein
MDLVLFLHTVSLNPSLSCQVYPFFPIVGLLGEVAGNTNKQLGFHGLGVSTLGFIAILRTLTVMGKTSFPSTSSRARMASSEWEWLSFCCVRILSLAAGSVLTFPFFLVF